MVLLLCHSAQVIRGRIGPARECDHQFIEGIGFLFGSVGPSHQWLWPVAAASLSLSPASSTSSRTMAGTRPESRFYSKALCRVDPPSATTSAAGALFDQFVGGTGITSMACSSPEAWLNQNTSQNSVAKLATTLIVTCLKKSLKCTAVWCPLQTTNRGSL